MFDLVNPFMYWLAQGQNAAGVQAITSIAALLVTVFLFGATWRYVVLTQNIAKTMGRQLSASVQPFLGLTFLDHCFITSANRPNIEIGGRLALKNLGGSALKVCSVLVLVRYKQPNGDFEQVPCPLTEADNLVLVPDQEQVYEFLFDTGKPSNSKLDFDFSLAADCTDLAGVSEHSFYLDYAGRLRHFFGFRRPLGGWKLQWLKMKHSVFNRLRRRSNTANHPVVTG